MGHRPPPSRGNPPSAEQLIWTPRLMVCEETLRSPKFGLLLKARLLELALAPDGKVALEAIKLLLTLAGSSDEGLDSVLANLPPEVLESARDAAINLIVSQSGSGSADGAAPDRSATSEEVLSTLRTTDYAGLPVGETPPVDHGSITDGGSGSDPLSDRLDASETRQE